MTKCFHHQCFSFLSVLPSVLRGINCGFKCRNIWDGHGVWEAEFDRSDVAGSGSGSGRSVRNWKWMETIPNSVQQNTGKYVFE